jgi:serine/threonine-protein kinase
VRGEEDSASADEVPDSEPPLSEDGRLTPALGTLGAGYKLGRYELLLPIAQGGMAVVWAARMKGTRGFSKIVAVKTMLPTLSGDPHFQQLFLTEAELASRIKHPNVCEILDLGEQRHVLYLVMEWIEGESLATLLSACRERERRIPYAVATRLVLDAARGLHAAHELRGADGELVGLVHRDVSPQNILVTYDGLVKIVDFGVAKAALQSEQQPTKSGHLKGKVQYMAPEQAFCDAIDRRTDVFTLGIVLYQLTTGIHPFRADNELATLARITSPEPVASPDTLARGYPRLLAAAVMKALEKDPTRRFATMAELAQELEIVLAKLAALGEAEDVLSFVRAVLGDRAALREASIRDALRDADARGEPPRSVAADTRKPPSSDGAESGASGVMVVPPASRWDARRAVVLGGLGAATVAGLVWAWSASRPPPGPASAPAVARSFAPAPEIETVVARAPAGPGQAAPAAPAPPAPDPSATAPSAAAAEEATAPRTPRKTPTPAPTAAKKPSPASSASEPKFRKPDF